MGEGQGQRLCFEVCCRLKEAAHHLRSLRSREGADGVHEGPTGGGKGSGRAEQGGLELGQLGEVLTLESKLDLRMATKGAAPAARSVEEDLQGRC